MIFRVNCDKLSVFTHNTTPAVPRREFGLAKAEADQRAVQIQGLRCDLAGAAARLSDMSGELSESQKIEREELKAKVQQQMRQIEIQRDSIEVLTLELEKVNTKLANVPDKLPKVSFVDLVGSICYLYSSDVCIILYPPSG